MTIQNFVSPTLFGPGFKKLVPRSLFSVDGIVFSSSHPLTDTKPRSWCWEQPSPEKSWTCG